VSSDLRTTLLSEIKLEESSLPKRDKYFGRLLISKEDGPSKGEISQEPKGKLT
jgi:hypothetical protein